MHQLFLPSDIVSKKNNLIRSKISISSVDGSRILASLVAKIDPKKQTFEEVYSISASDFVKNASGSTYARVKKVCRELASSTAEVEFFDGVEKGFKIYTFFSCIEYKKGKISASFNEKMRPFLLELNHHFTQYNLLEYLTLPSVYSQRIFEILKSWSGLPEIEIPLKDLYEMLSFPISMRKDFAKFRVKVLEKAHKDITKNRLFLFEYEIIKNGRSAEAIKFIFTAKKRAILAEKTAEKALDKATKERNSLVIKAVNCCRAGNCKKDYGKKVCELCEKMGLKTQFE